MNQEKKGILLESGTNELEVILFEVGIGTFGINVMKVREIIQPLALTTMPHSHAYVEGIIRLRDEVIPVIDLAKALGYEKSVEGNQDKLVVAELNQVKVAFHVHSVSRIHRISWEQIEKPNKLSQGLQDLTIGVIKMEEAMILLLDYEKIVYDIMPEAGMSISKIDGIERKDRSHKQVLIAEDSPVLRDILKNTLTEAGYRNLIFTEEGKEAWEYLQSSPGEKVDLLVTDIEMPTMDGHHLTKKVKEDPKVQHLPVIIFSSLITGDLYHKGVQVGADAQISKPELGKLVEELDRLLNL
ncbi:chemotaxis protein CheV [Salipaludibacillus neizhouensis]|uniref:Chemotaxis protein CheV n=1 Tax=Salipaludibacillus neizhouensis TaxID=885475 RepID=A0A3A9KXM5_9BACI|nr:chemotaxis protein [Salipaludibacillus neizhouensis]RKL69186.1 chemotaxis protein CheV [Salipaludibacillus neizhouensis]